MYEVLGDEVLSVEEVQTAKQTAIIKKHHTFVRHIQASGQAEISIGEVVEIVFEWHDWQGNPLPETEAFVVDVAGQRVEVLVEETMEFSADEPGEYTIRTVNPNVENAELVVKVVTSGA